jgi:hypothetical protein
LRYTGEHTEKTLVISYDARFRKMSKELVQSNNDDDDNNYNNKNDANNNTGNWNHLTQIGKYLSNIRGQQEAKELQKTSTWPLHTDFGTY